MLERRRDKNGREREREGGISDSDGQKWSCGNFIARNTIIHYIYNGPGHVIESIRENVFIIYQNERKKGERGKKRVRFLAERTSVNGNEC